jgi:hypothetical protein
MLETLVPSKVRRTLLEHLLLARPDERFYLRGLAKSLSLSISPLRRELLRLESLGVLMAYDEANIRFYVVNQQSPLFLQLKQASVTIGETPTARVELPVEILEEPKDADPRPAQQPVRSARAVRIPWRGLRLACGAVSLVAGLGLVFGSIVRFAVPKPAPRRVLVTPVVPETYFASPAPVPEPMHVDAPVAGSPAASGEMRSSRWRLQPGTIGGGWSQ